MKKAIEVSRREFLAGCGTVVGSAVLRRVPLKPMPKRATCASGYVPLSPNT